MSSKHSKLFLITGVSSGFGRAFAEAALAAGHRVVGETPKLGRTATGLTVWVRGWCSIAMVSSIPL